MKKDDICSVHFISIVCKVNFQQNSVIIRPYPVLGGIAWQAFNCHKVGIRVDQKLNGICVLNEKAK